MREVEGMSYEEMAQAMGVSKGTIMSRLFHARQKLQRALADCYAEEEGKAPRRGPGGDRVSTASSSKANHGEPSAPPTDMELMLYVDGELDEARYQQVEEYVLHDPRCRAKVAALVTAADMVQDERAGLRAADGIADGVMAKILEGSGARRGWTGAPSRRRSRRRPSRASRPGRSGDGSREQPANDNSRGIFALDGARRGGGRRHDGLGQDGRGGTHRGADDIGARRVARPAAEGALRVARGAGEEPDAARSSRGRSSPASRWPRSTSGARMGADLLRPAGGRGFGPDDHGGVALR